MAAQRLDLLADQGQLGADELRRGVAALDIGPQQAGQCRALVRRGRGGLDRLRRPALDIGTMRMRRMRSQTAS